MKTKLAMVIWLLGIACMAQELWDKVKDSVKNPIEVKTSQLKPNKLVAGFEDVQNRLFILTNGVIIQTEIPMFTSYSARHLNCHAYHISPELAKTGYHLVKTDITRVFSDDKYMIIGGGVGKVMLQIPGDTSYTVGKKIYGLAIESGEYDYTSTEGAPLRISKWTLVSTSAPTYDQFVAALKAGASFTCWLEVEDACPACQGAKSVKRTDGKSGKGKCGHCKGTGKLSDKYVCRIVW